MTIVRLIFPAAAVAVSAPVQSAPPPLIVTATQPGGQALDSDRYGGNPFASAFIQVIGRKDLDLPTALAELRLITEDLSRSFQSPSMPKVPNDFVWSLGAPDLRERNLALVVVMAEYKLSSGLKPLPGAAFDAIRVGRKLRQVGYATTTVVAGDLAEYRAALATFRSQSAEAANAIIYTTGHGTEVDKVVWLLDTRFPTGDGTTAFAKHAITLDTVAKHAAARKRNLVFYGGCRDNPFATEQEPIR